MDNLTKEQRRKNMRHIRSEGTTPERKVMRELRKRKIYFAGHVKKIIGKPDIVFRRKKIAIFIDSDFWHGHPKRFIMPATNYEYWSSKIARNKERDKQVTKELRLKGWKVIRLWEYDIKHNFEKSIKNILVAIGRNNQKNLFPSKQ
jgi:DNA mismatch endonuclease (patch repair protein)